MNDIRKYMATSDTGYECTVIHDEYTNEYMMYAVLPEGHPWVGAKIGALPEDVSYSNASADRVSVRTGEWVVGAAFTVGPGRGAMGGLDDLARAWKLCRRVAYQAWLAHQEVLSYPFVIFGEWPFGYGAQVREGGYGSVWVDVCNGGNNSVVQLDRDDVVRMHMWTAAYLERTAGKGDGA